MDASGNLAHLNSVLQDLTTNDVTYVPRDDADEEIDEYESDEDYELPEEAFERWVHVPRDALLHVWRQQRGMCAVSSLPMDPLSTGLYGATPVPERLSQPLSDANVKFVLTGVARMRDATGLPWSAFGAFLARLRPPTWGEE